MITATEIVTAFITLYPTDPARICMRDRRESIEEVLNTARETYPEMPMEMLASIGFLETHLGCYGGGGWGAPLSRTQRHLPGTPMRAAGILWRSFQVCRNWEGAARRFRTGLCSHSDVGDSYARRAIRMANTLRVHVNRSKTYASR
jgi:hypothetical protein